MCKFLARQQVQDKYFANKWSRGDRIKVRGTVTVQNTKYRQHSVQSTATVLNVFCHRDNISTR